MRILTSHDPLVGSTPRRTGRFLGHKLLAYVPEPPAEAAWEDNTAREFSCKRAKFRTAELTPRGKLGVGSNGIQAKSDEFIRPKLCKGMVPAVPV